MNKTEIQKRFERLISEHKATIYSVCYMFADNTADTEDLFQDVLINLWQGFESFRGDCSERSWVYRVSLNACISYRRKKKKHSMAHLDIVPEMFDDATTEGRQNLMLHRRITRLEKFDRAIVLLWLEDMSYDEIGAIVGLTPKAVGVRLVRIKEKLKSL